MSKTMQEYIEEGEQVLLFGTPYTLHTQLVVSKEKAHVSFDG